MLLPVARRRTARPWHARNGCSMTCSYYQQAAIVPATAIAVALLTAALLLPPGPAGADTATCVSSSGREAERCLKRANRSRRRGSSEGNILLRTRRAVTDNCDDDDAWALGYPGLVNMASQVPRTCTTYATELDDTIRAVDDSLLSRKQLRCRNRLARVAGKLADRLVQTTGRDCLLVNYTGSGCDRLARDLAVADRRQWAVDRASRSCGDDLDAVVSAPGVDIGERTAAFVDSLLTRWRHYAQATYPPNDLDATAALGQWPVGVTTLQMADVSRLDVDGLSARPVAVELFYPSTAAATAGIPLDATTLMGGQMPPSPAYRDVAMATGSFPLLVFSHGFAGTRNQSIYLVTHLASHGYVVASPDHHGNTLPDLLNGVVDFDSAVNRPVDISFLLDELLAANATPGDFLEGAIDATRIGMSGHSFGGYTTLAIAGGAFFYDEPLIVAGFEIDPFGGTFTDTRVKAIAPLAPAAFMFDDAFFTGITVPTMLMAGTLDQTTPLADNQQRPFDNLPANAPFTALGTLLDGGHLAFSHACDIPGPLGNLLTGDGDACSPLHLPWRHGHDIINYLLLNFFDAALAGDTAALARLSAASTNDIEDLALQAK
ncbi:MAG: hypothetical protein H8E45_04950 [Proteobacteria bacterium]|nr:hypothetical protein [Pseudomonadota bacterium]